MKDKDGGNFQKAEQEDKWVKIRRKKKIRRQGQMSRHLNNRKKRENEIIPGNSPELRHVNLQMRVQ